jgi:MFS family permease
VTPAEAQPPQRLGRRLLLAVMVPFACGYFLSYLIRNVNAVIAPDLVAAFHLDASDLGLLTSAYFLGFALFQFALGVLLDRYGPRRVEGSLLIVAGCGALVFAFSRDTAMLIAGRILIGVGVSACLMAAFKANAIWFSRERLPAMNGWILGAGGLGVVCSTAPVEWVLLWLDWRTLFICFALAFAIVSAMLFGVVPERHGDAGRDSFTEQFRGFVEVANSREFWRIAPLAMFSQSTFMSLQGLWAARWMKDVGGFARDDIAACLLLAAVSMVAGHLTMGNLASRLALRGIAPSYVAGGGVALGVAVQLLLVAGYTGAQAPLWVLFGFLGTAGTVSFALLAQAYPASMAGRANTALNLVVFSVTFLVQWGMGVIINRFPSPAGDGSYLATGYSLAFGIAAALQAATLLWFFRRMPRPA